MIETEPVNLTTMMRNILNEVTLELEEKQITAHNMLPEGLTVQGNSSLLYSIFRNLTDNAIAYAGTHISITIRCFREDERFYYFSFSDTGVGVGPEHLSRLFERFYRVDKGRSRKLGGLLGSSPRSPSGSAELAPLGQSSPFFLRRPCDFTAR